jgi:NAD+ synthase (glutamine-hydrolysing)
MVKSAAEQGANIVLFGEMAATGYPIEDLAIRKRFILDAEKAVEAFASRLLDAGLGDTAVIIGHPAPVKSDPQGSGWAGATNSASIIFGGKVHAQYAKHHLPNYGVFDEYRNFKPGSDLVVFDHSGLKFGIAICEDIWQSGGPVSGMKKAGVDCLLVLNGSPFEVTKGDERLEVIQDVARQQECAIAYVNLVGGQDDLVFDGDSLIVDASGQVIGRGKQFDIDLVLFDLTDKQTIDPVKASSSEKPDELWQIWQALVTGLRDYVDKNGFKSVILGLSGGIDSAVCAALAADAIGKDRVFGVSMPSKYSSEHSKSDAFDLAKRLGIECRIEPIKGLVKPVERQLRAKDLAAENLQARMRGVILMTLSNLEGHLVLTTGNKSELAVGYSTIYGDSVGGFAPLKDVEKTLVWVLAQWRNDFAVASGEIEPIPKNSIEKPPSAELRPGQVDQDSLPPYDLLDGILAAYINERLSREEITSRGYDEATVTRIANLVDRAEWKRRQGAIGPKITSMSFGRDRRMPITNKYSG